MSVLAGNTSGSVRMITLDIPGVITSFSVTNKTGGAGTFTLLIGTTTKGEVLVRNVQPLAANASYSENECAIKVAIGYYITIIGSVSVDYFFNIDAL